MRNNLKTNNMTIEQQAQKLIDEAYVYAPSSGYMQEKFAIEIAIWCAKKIGSNIGFSDNDEYWSDVIKHLEVTEEELPNQFTYKNK